MHKSHASKFSKIMRTQKDFFVRCIQVSVESNRQGLNQYINMAVSGSIWKTEKCLLKVKHECIGPHALLTTINMFYLWAALSSLVISTIHNFTWFQEDSDINNYYIERSDIWNLFWIDNIWINDKCWINKWAIYISYIYYVYI